MHPLSILLILFIGGALLFVSVPQIFLDAKKAHGRRRVLLALGGLLLAVGLAGFFGSALSAVGGLNWLRPSFEWPVGFASGVITTKDRTHIVPHTPSGRIQVYDADWRFLRGWHVDAGGGKFKLIPSDPYTFEVITARGQHHYVFNLDGRLDSSGTYSPRSYSEFPTPTEAYFVPTALWLWPFSNPFISWGVGASGMVLLIIQSKLSKKRRASK